MKIWVIEADNSLSYEDYTTWFVGLALSVEDAEKYIKNDLVNALQLVGEKPEEFSPMTDHPKEVTKDAVYHWEWQKIVWVTTFYIHSYELEGICKC